MASLKLTKRVVDNAEPRATRFTIFDTEIRGFGLRIFPSGQKSWVFEYRPGGGGRRTAKKRITIGAADTFTPDQARKQADKLRARTRLGEDPHAEKLAKRQALTVAEIAKIFLSEHVGPKRKPRTKAHYKWILKRFIRPKIGTMKARDVKRSDVARIHLALKKTPFQANQVLIVASTLYGFAQRRALVPDGTNPAHGLEKYPEPRRERFLSVKELQRVGDTIREAETVGIPWRIDLDKETKHVPKTKPVTVIGIHAAGALRLLIFTGARLREILHLKWEYVDFERGLLLLPDSKTGRKTIVLNAPALEVLASLPRVGSYVIAGGDEGKPRADLKRPWALVRRRAGLQDVRLHDLRHTYASFGARGGMGLPVIGKLLGHAEPRTTHRYAHLDADPLRRATNAIGHELAAAMGEPSSKPGTVVKLSKDGAA